MNIARHAIDDAIHDSTRGSRKRGQLRAREILHTAQDIFADEGYHRLTLRRIADKLGISNGNVTYYFANKEILLKALISDNLARYDDAFEREQRTFSDDPAARTRAYFIFLVEDAKTPRSQRFFYQLWALASHNSKVALQRNRVYEHFLAQVQAQLYALRPEMEEDEMREKCFLLMSLIEGMNVICGSQRALRKNLDVATDRSVEHIMRIIES